MIQSKVIFTRHELFAEISLEMRGRMAAFCEAVDNFAARAAATGQTKIEVSESAHSTRPRL